MSDLTSIKKELKNLENIEHSLMTIINFVEFLKINPENRRKYPNVIWKYLDKNFKPKKNLIESLKIFTSKKLQRLLYTDDERSKLIIEYFEKFGLNDPLEGSEAETAFIDATLFYIKAVRRELIEKKSEYEREKVEEREELKRIKVIEKEKEKVRKIKQKEKIISQRLRKKIIEKFEKNNKSLINKFLDITRRKVSIINEYGYEDLDALYQEIATVIKILMKQVKQYPLSQINRLIDEYIDHIDFNKLPNPYNFIAEYLEITFKKYNKKNQTYPTVEKVDELSGTEFETYICQLLKSNGFTEVRGTPKTGDQGADILAKINGKLIAVQAKRHIQAIGNSAVQEIVAAIKYYGANEGWVITNSVFTPSARALAQKNDVELIDKYTLINFNEFILKKFFNASNSL